jgi:hypothetical protein
MNLDKLKRVELRDVWKGEANGFTPWLAKEENIRILSEEIGIDLEVQNHEEKVGPFRADILCKDTSTDHFVLIENQLERTDHNHLGQLMTYAAGLDAVTIIWIAKKFTEEHRAALDWLNNKTNESVEFFGIEIELYQIGNSDPAPKFNIISKPNDWSKTIRRTADSGQFTETKLLQQEYWQSFKNYVEKNNERFKMQKPLPQHWTNISIGSSKIRLQAIMNTRDKRIGVILNLHGPNALEDFRKLRTLYEEQSKKEISPKIEWEEKEGKEHHIKYILDKLNPTDRTDWEFQNKNLAKWVRLFYNFFKDKIKNI